VLGAIGSSSELIVRWNATTGECTAIDVTNTSYFAPMAP
jgi:hypothetical protein